MHPFVYTAESRSPKKSSPVIRVALVMRRVLEAHVGPQGGITKSWANVRMIRMVEFA